MINEQRQRLHEGPLIEYWAPSTRDADTLLRDLSRKKNAMALPHGRLRVCNPTCL